jgi:transposase
MGQTKKRHYDSYTLSYKKQAIKFASLPSVMATDVAKVLGIHVVLLYRWRMQLNQGTLGENSRVKKDKSASIEKQKEKLKARDLELSNAKKQIKALERSLSASEEELDILKKAKRFFTKVKK